VTEQERLDERLRIVMYELLYGTADPLWADGKKAELLAAGARWHRTPEETTYGISRERDH
jgi:hypothetical protein